MSVHFERIADELVMTVRDDDDEDGESMVVSFPIPQGVDELLTTIREEANLNGGAAAYGTPPGWTRSPIDGKYHRQET